MLGRKRTDSEARKIALRRARAFASHGHSHLAEVEINRALLLGASMEETSNVLETLPADQPAGLISRREALKRSSALLAGGTLMGTGVLAARPVRAAAAEPASSLRGVFIKITLMNGRDDSFEIRRITTAGLREVPGIYRGYTFSSGGAAYVVSQSWETGAPVTVTSIISADGKTKTLTTVASGGRNGASVAESLTMAVKRDSYLYVASTWVRTYPAPGAPNMPEAKRGKSPIRVTTQENLQVIDAAGGSLAASWTGEEQEGACLAALKVSDDGRGIVLSTDAPGQAPASMIRRWLFDGTTLTLASAGPARADLVYALGSKHYRWQTSRAALVQVGGSAIYSHSVDTGKDRVFDLPVLHGSNSKTPRFQGITSRSGSLVVSSGDGRYATWSSARAELSAARTMPAGGLKGASSAELSDPPLLVYSGIRLGDIFAAAGSSLWVIDNREGVGGMWRLDGSLNPVDHKLPGNYLASCVADETDSYVAAYSPVESAIYLIGPSGETQAFRVPSYTELVPRSY